MYITTCLPEMERNEQLNLVSLAIYNCAWQPGFLKSSHVLGLS